MNELVKITNNQVVTSSLQIAEVFGKQHKHVLDLLSRKLGSVNGPELSKHFLESKYQDSTGRSLKMYYMDRDGFSFLVMGFTGVKADTWKLKYIEAFNEMEKCLTTDDKVAYLVAREKGKEARRSLTDAIKEWVPDSPHKGYAYRNYTELVYKTIFKKSTKELREERGVLRDGSLRDALEPVELQQVELVEAMAKNLLFAGKTYNEVKDILQLTFPNGVHLALTGGKNAIN